MGTAIMADGGFALVVPEIGPGIEINLAIGAFGQAGFTGSLQETIRTVNRFPVVIAVQRHAVTFGLPIRNGPVVVTITGNNGPRRPEDMTFMHPIL
jgi:hypothetical protein